jgi:hypothetical protein
MKPSTPDTDHFQNYLNNVFTVILYYNFQMTQKFRTNSDTHNAGIRHKHDLFRLLTPANTRGFNTLELGSAVPHSASIS